MSYTIRAQQAVLPGHEAPVPATIVVKAGKIASVVEGEASGDAAGEVVDIGAGRVLVPGLIDSHVHLNQPGRTAWEGFATGTAAALAGGVTTLIDMPLNSIPPTTTVANLGEKRQAATATGVRCDVGFWGGIIPGNAGDLKPLLAAGAKGFKCFLIESGVDEFPCVGEADLIAACDALQGTNALVMFHAELERVPGSHSHAQPEAYATFLASRPPQLELDALSLILSLARRYPSLRFHIVHLSAADALAPIRAARAGTDGGAPVANLTVETCFHYLTLAAEGVPDNATSYKCCPPIRPEANRQLLREAVIDGTIDYVVSDHSPCTPELKKGDFMSAWGGVSGLGFGLPLLWTEFGREVPLPRVVGWLSAAQAAQVGLAGTKGEIRPGADADFAVFDPDASVEVTQADLLFRNKQSAYIGKTLRGRVDRTYLRGEAVWDADDAAGSLAAETRGQLL
ncbi:Allantoinase [Vanrija albida]|uniref:allantoinase n=1 Tax=Vanrija albida TaxID=181172 RepID=A0ABR3Q2X3_9TREE